MAATRPNEAVMHCSNKEPVEVYNLALNIINDGIYVNAGTFATPPIALGVPSPRVF